MVQFISLFDRKLSVFKHTVFICLGRERKRGYVKFNALKKLFGKEFITMISLRKRIIPLAKKQKRSEGGIVLQAESAGAGCFGELFSLIGQISWFLACFPALCASQLLHDIIPLVLIGLF
mgnify:CR=1 FL=1